MVDKLRNMDFMLGVSLGFIISTGMKIVLELLK